MNQENLLMPIPKSAFEEQLEDIVTQFVLSLGGMFNQLLTERMLIVVLQTLIQDTLTPKEMREAHPDNLRHRAYEGSKVFFSTMLNELGVFPQENYAMMLANEVEEDFKTETDYETEAVAGLIARAASTDDTPTGEIAPES